MDSKTLAYTRAAALLLLFAVICAFTAMIMNINVGQPLVAQQLDTNGGMLGPFRIADDGTVLEIKVWQNPDRESWNFVAGSVLDAEQNYLFGFGDEMWHETGYDEGYWSETKNSYDAKIRLPQGQYYLNFETEIKPGSTPGPVSVRVERQLGSSLPFWVLAVIALIAAVLSYRRSEATPEEMLAAFRRNEHGA